MVRPTDVPAAEICRSDAEGACAAAVPLFELAESATGAHIPTMGQRAFDYRDLPIPERVQLVEDIWDSIAQEANARADTLPLTESQRAELDRRVADADAHPEASVHWESVRDELFKRGG